MRREIAETMPKKAFAYRVVPVVLLSLTAIGVSPASAQVTTRDHRTQPPPPAPAREVPPPAGQVTTRDHRTQEQPTATVSGGVAIGVTTRRYRRRPGPRYMLPLKVDIGGLGMSTKRGFIGGIEARAGVHWASLSPTPTNFDIGIGGFIAGVSAQDNMAIEDSDDDTVMGGAYLEVSQTLAHGNYWRTWAGGRGEYFSYSAFDRKGTGLGAAGRLSAELYVSGVGIEPRGLFLGTYAIGAYAEVGLRDIGSGSLGVSGGLTFRTPFVFAP